MTEDRGADRAGGKADEISAEGKQRCRQRLLVGEVELAEDETGGGAVKEEVVPLDGGADGRSDHRLAQLRAVFSLRQRHVCRCHSHGVPPRIRPLRSGPLAAGPPYSDDTSGRGRWL